MQDCIYIIGGGPSLKGFDFSKLEGKDTFAVNSSLQDVPNPTYFITCCSGFARRAVSGKFWGKKTKTILVVTERSIRYSKYFDEVISFNRCEGGIGFSKDDFVSGYNSGFCALQYSVLAGYKKIYLLGIDLNITGGQHYHNRTSLIVKDLDNFYRAFVSGLEALKNTDIKVYYCSPTSRLNEHIEYIPFKKVGV